MRHTGNRRWDRMTSFPVGNKVVDDEGKMSLSFAFPYNIVWSFVQSILVSLKTCCSSSSSSFLRWWDWCFHRTRTSLRSNEWDHKKFNGPWLGAAPQEQTEEQFVTKLSFHQENTTTTSIFGGSLLLLGGVFIFTHCSRTPFLTNLFFDVQTLRTDWRRY